MPSGSPEDDSRSQILRDFGFFFVAAATIGVSSGLGVGLGYWGYLHWGFPWWALLLSSLAGLALGTWKVYIDAQNLEKKP